MLTLAWPWLLLALPLPLVVRWLLPRARAAQDAALRVPELTTFERVAGIRRSGGLRRWPLLLGLLAWSLLVTAAARPEWLGEAVQLPVSGRDLMLAVDLSRSMNETDFYLRGELVDRLTASKAVADDFIARRRGDRVGLILFGERAYLQTPLTFDRDTVRILLSEAAIGLAGKATAIGDAIGLAVKRLRGENVSSKVLVLLTDGASNAGEIDPLKAADLAAREGLRIYTIGIGADEMTVRSLFGSRVVNPSADLDEETLKAIAERTGGRYFRARDTEELSSIYSYIDELEPVEKDSRSFRPTTALFHWPLGAALAIAAVMGLARVRPRWLA